MKVKQKGFTLIELLVVISIIGLLSSIVLAALSVARGKATVAAGLEFANYNYHAIGDQTILYWNFTSCPTVSDTSGYNITGTLVGTANCMTDTPSGSGKSFFFNGSTDITANFPTGLSMSSHTVSVWIKIPSTITTTQQIIQSTGCTNTDCVALMLYPSNLIYFGPPYNNTGGWITTTYTLPINTWINLTYVYSPCSVNYCYTLYLNGAQISSQQNSLGVTGNMSTASVGGSGAGTYFSGYMDDLVIYNKSLTADDIHTIYAMGMANHGLALQ